MAGSSLSCACGIMRATNKQSKAPTPAGLPPVWFLAPFSLGAEEGGKRKRERQMGAWPRRQQQCLAREGIDKEPRNPPGTLARWTMMGSVCLHSTDVLSPPRLSCLLHSCSIPSSRPQQFDSTRPPLSRRPRTASGLGRSTACRFISIGLDTHSQFPNQEPPANSPVTTQPDSYVSTLAQQCRQWPRQTCPRG